MNILVVFPLFIYCVAAVDKWEIVDNNDPKIEKVGNFAATYIDSELVTSYHYALSDIITARKAEQERKYGVIITLHETVCSKDDAHNTPPPAFNCRFRYESKIGINCTAIVLDIPCENKMFMGYYKCHHDT